MPRPIMTLIAGLFLFFALLAPATALAEPFTPELEADYQAALEWWSVPSPPQCASVRREIVPGYPEGKPDGSTIAFADATQPAPEASGIECVLQYYGVPSRLAGTPCVKEMVVRHEVGHLVGLGHSADPESIMAPGIDFEAWCPGEVFSPELEALGRLAQLQGRLDLARESLHAKSTICGHLQRQGARPALRLRCRKEEATRRRDVRKDRISTRRQARVFNTIRTASLTYQDG